MGKVILITGPSGSGKTTLGNKIKNKFKNVLIVDSDEIDDKSFLYLYENDIKFKNMVENNKGNPQKIHQELNIKKRDEIIKNNKDKNIIFIGLTISLDGIDHIGYYINLPFDENFRRLNKRTLDDICNNRKNLKKMFDQEKKEIINLLMLYKYGIRQIFPVNYNSFKKFTRKQREDAINKDYKILSSEKILIDLDKILNMNGGYYNKYITCKNRYLNLKKQIGGRNIIIHISGSQGSGKTTLGNKLKEIYQNEIHVKDLDDLRNDAYGDNETDFQKYINDYIQKHNDKPLIFTGLDADLCLGGVEPEETDKIYNLHAEYKFYINLPQEQILRQRFLRQIDKLQQRKEWFFDTWLKNPQMINAKLMRFIDLEGWKKQMKNCDKLYQDREYKFIGPEEIIKIINSLLHSQ